MWSGIEIVVICGSVGVVHELKWVQGVWDDGVDVNAMNSLSKHVMATNVSATGAIVI